MATAAIRPVTLSTPYYLNLFAKETKYEFLKATRNRMYSLATLGFPIMFYLLFGVSNRHSGLGLQLRAISRCRVQLLWHDRSSALQLRRRYRYRARTRLARTETGKPHAKTRISGSESAHMHGFRRRYCHSAGYIGNNAGQCAHYAVTACASWRRSRCRVNSLCQPWHAAFSADASECRPRRHQSNLFTNVVLFWSVDAD